MGGGDNFWILWGDTAVMRGDIELMGDPPVPPLGKTLKCGLQTPWFNKDYDKRIYSGITVLVSNKLFHESLYIVGRKP